MNYYGIQLEIKLNVQSIMSFYHLNFDDKYRYSGEYHNFWEMVYVKSGKLGVTADTGIYELESGMAVFHKPNEFHNLWSAGGTKPEIYICTFLCEDEYLRFFEDAVLNLNSFQQNLILKLGVALEGKIECGTKDGNHICRITDGTVDLQNVKSLLEVLLCDLKSAETVKTGVLKTKSVLTHYDIFGNAIRFLKENISSMVVADDVCRVIGVSNTTLKRVFKKYAGESVKKYFIDLKIQKAKELLADGRMVGEVSDALGFSTQNYFCYCFKRETGQTPFEFKTENCNK